MTGEPTSATEAGALANRITVRLLRTEDEDAPAGWMAVLLRSEREIFVNHLLHPDPLAALAGLRRQVLHADLEGSMRRDVLTVIDRMAHFHAPDRTAGKWW